MAQYYMLHKPRGLLTAKRRRAAGDGHVLLSGGAARRCIRSGGWTRIRKACCCLRTTACWTCVCSGPSSMWKRNTNTAHSGICTTMLHAAAGDGRFAPRGQPLAAGPRAAAFLRIRTLGKARRICRSASAKKYLKNPSRPVTLGRLWITEGRKHQVKLMIKAVGGHVFYLKRLAIGPVRLDEMLRPGEYRPLTAEELAALMPPATNGGGTAGA